MSVYQTQHGHAGFVYHPPEVTMACDPRLLRQIPLFALLDDDEMAVLAEHVELKSFSARERIYKAGDEGLHAYALLSGSVRVTAVDDDHQEVVVDEPEVGGFFGFASMLDQSPHQTDAMAIEASSCIEIDREDIADLLKKKPHAAMDMLRVLGRQVHGAQQLVRKRAARNPNDLIEEKATFGEKVADAVAGFGGSWTFIILFLSTLVVYTMVNLLLRSSAWDPYPFILLNLFLSMLAALQAPVIMMSQNRQDSRDRLRGELDYEVDRRAALEIQGLSRKLNLVHEKIADMEDLLRGKASRGSTA